MKEEPNFQLYCKLFLLISIWVCVKGGAARLGVTDKRCGPYTVPAEQSYPMKLIVEADALTQLELSFNFPKLALKFQ